MTQGAASNKRPRALVIGGNFGGLGAGIALQEAGFDATVFERAPEIEALQRAVGGLHQWPNAIRAADILGVGNAMRERGIVYTRTDMYLQDGTLCSTWPLDELERDLGCPTLQILRRDLHDLLLDRFRRAGGEVQAGKACAGFTQDRDSVTAQFEDGSEAQGAVLVGADGLNSVIRAQLHGRSEPRYGGFLLRGSTKLTDGSLAPGVMNVYYGKGTQIVVAQNTPEDAAWFLRSVELSKDEANDVDAIRRLFQDWPETVRRAVDATVPGSMTSADNFDRDPLEHWGERRVTLLGDAAHPMLNTLSQGAAQALEDAAVLKLTFDEHGIDDVAAALLAYEERRRPRSAEFVKRSRTFGKIGLMRNPILLAFRNRFLLRSPIAWKQQRKSVRAAF